MKLTRYFFISNSLDDLEAFEQDLERADVVTPQIHLLTLNEDEAERHHNLHKMTSFMKKDIVHSTLIGAVAGLSAAALTLIITQLAGWSETSAGWAPFIFLAIVFLGFFTWQGGMWGIQKPNVHFKRFEKTLQAGKHVFFVDVENRHKNLLKTLTARHVSIESAGIGRAAPSSIVFMQHHLKHFFTEVFP